MLNNTNSERTGERTRAKSADRALKLLEYLATVRTAVYETNARAFLRWDRPGPRH